MSATTSLSRAVAAAVSSAVSSASLLAAAMKYPRPRCARVKEYGWPSIVESTPRGARDWRIISIRSSRGPWSCRTISVILARSSLAPPGAWMILTGLASPCRSACEPSAAKALARRSLAISGRVSAGVARLLSFVACLAYDCGQQRAAELRVVVETVG